MSTAARASKKMKVVHVVLIVGSLALGIASFEAYFDQRAETRSLQEDGVETEADVVSVDRYPAGRRSLRTILLVSYDPGGRGQIEFGDVFPCSEVHYEPGAEKVRIVYLPGEPEAVRLAGCVSSIDSWIPVAVGGGLIALAIFLVWRLVGLRRT